MLYSTHWSLHILRLPNKVLHITDSSFCDTTEKTVQFLFLPATWSRAINNILHAIQRPLQKQLVISFKNLYSYKLLHDMWRNKFLAVSIRTVYLCDISTFYFCWDVGFQAITTVDVSTHTTSQTLWPLQWHEADFTVKEAVCKQLFFLPTVVLNQNGQYQYWVTHVLR